jgi:hypothetical protein
MSFIRKENKRSKILREYQIYDRFAEIWHVCVEYGIPDGLYCLQSNKRVSKVREKKLLHSLWYNFLFFCEKQMPFVIYQVDSGEFYIIKPFTHNAYYDRKYIKTCFKKL